MASELLYKGATSSRNQFVFNSSMSPAAVEHDLRDATSGNRTDVTLALTGKTDGQAQASAKADLGSIRAPMYNVLMTTEFAVAPTAGKTVDLYWAPSTHATAGNGNLGELTGASAAYTGVTAVDDSVKMFMYIGSFVLENDTDVQSGYVGTFSPPTQWGQLVVVNRSGQTMVSNNDEHHVVFNPIIPEGQ